MECGGTLVDTDLRDAHLVGGQSSRFVRADDIGTTKGLNTGEVPNDCVLLGHFFGSKSETCGNDGGKTLWDGGDCECYGDFEVIDSTMKRATVGWIPEVLEVDDPDENTNDTDYFGEHVAKIIQLAFEGRLLVDFG